jgi:hypothetical protein
MNRDLLWTKLINYGLFQCGWFICVVGAASGYPWPATVAGCILVLIHVALVRHRLREGILLLLSLMLGLAIDAYHIRTGVLSFPFGNLHPDLPPPWILVLWLQFAMTLHYSLAWLEGRYLLGTVLGAISGALAYWAGVRLGAAYFSDDLIRCLVQVGVSWSIAMIILLRISSLTNPGKTGMTYRLFPDRK